MSLKRNGKFIKWLPETSPKACVSEIAQDVIKQRFKPIRRLLKLVRTKWRREPEHVHRLRVATRRAQVALHFLADYLPEKPVRSMDRRLKRLRRAANVARDIDVLLLRYEKHPDPTCSEAEWSGLLRFLRKKRRDVQIKLDGLIDRRARKNFSQRIALLFDGDELGTTPPVSFHELLEQQLQLKLARFFQIAEGDHSEIETLHRLRIAGKRVRYVMELGAGAYPAAEFQRIYRSFCELQEQFGVVNDLASAVDVLDSFLSTRCKAIRRLLRMRIQAEQAALKKESDRLLKNWNEKSWQVLKQKFAALFNLDANAS